MELRALSLAEEAIARRDSWVRSLGDPPSGASRRERWLREVSTVAAYLDRWHIEGERTLGPTPDRENHEQTAQREKALAAGKWARAISRPAADQPISHAWNHRSIFRGELKCDPGSGSGC